MSTRKGPSCGHSACSQHYIDTGKPVCVARARGHWAARVGGDFIAIFKGRPTVAQARSTFFGTSRPIDIEPATQHDIDHVTGSGGIIHDVKEL